MQSFDIVSRAMPGTQPIHKSNGNTTRRPTNCKICAMISAAGLCRFTMKTALWKTIWQKQATADSCTAELDGCCERDGSTTSTGAKFACHRGGAESVSG